MFVSWNLPTEKKLRSRLRDGPVSRQLIGLSTGKTSSRVLGPQREVLCCTSREQEKQSSSIEQPVCPWKGLYLLRMVASLLTARSPQLATPGCWKLHDRDNSYNSPV